MTAWEVVSFVFRKITWVLIPIMVGVMLAYMFFDSSNPLSYLSSPYIFVLCVAGGVKLDELLS